MVHSRHYDLYSASQFHTQASGRLFKPSSADRWAIWCPGGAGVDYTFILADADPLAANQRDLMDAITAEMQLPILSLNTEWTWGNDTAMSRMDDLYAYATGTLGYGSEQVDLICGSMGLVTASAWAYRNPTLPRSITSLVGLAALAAFHDASPERLVGAADSINTAYGGLAAYNATVATRDPTQLAASIDHIPQRFWYSTTDPYCLAAEALAHAAAVGAEAVSLGAVGHTVDTLELGEVLAFLYDT